MLLVGGVSVNIAATVVKEISSGITPSGPHVLLGYTGDSKVLKQHFFFILAFPSDTFFPISLLPSNSLFFHCHLLILSLPWRLASFSNALPAYLWNCDASFSTDTRRGTISSLHLSPFSAILSFTHVSLSAFSLATV